MKNYCYSHSPKHLCLSLSVYRSGFCLVLTSRIDQKVSNSPYGYKLQEAQAILSEVRSIRDAISSGEKEKQELMQVNVIHIM